MTCLHMYGHTAIRVWQVVIQCQQLQGLQHHHFSSDHNHHHCCHLSSNLFGSFSSPVSNTHCHTSMSAPSAILSCLPASPNNMIIILTLYGGRGFVKAVGLVGCHDLSHWEAKKDTIWLKQLVPTAIITWLGMMPLEMDSPKPGLFETLTDLNLYWFVILMFWIKNSKHLVVSHNHKISHNSAIIAFHFTSQPSLLLLFVQAHHFIQYITTYNGWLKSLVQLIVSSLKLPYEKVALFLGTFCVQKAYGLCVKNLYEEGSDDDDWLRTSDLIPWDEYMEIWERIAKGAPSEGQNKKPFWKSLKKKWMKHSMKPMFWCWGCWLCHLLMTRRRLWSARAMICKVLSNKCFQIKEKGLLVTLPLEKELLEITIYFFQE